MTRPRQVVRRTVDEDFRAPSGQWAAGSTGFSRWTVVGESDPAVHTGLVVSSLEPGGRVPAHVHSHEEAVYLLSGTVVLQTPEGAVRLVPGDYGLLPIGTSHSWRNDGSVQARWVEMVSPQPRERFGDDTFGVPEIAPSAAHAVDVRDPRNRYYGHISPDAMDAEAQTQDKLAVSASMRTALLVYSGITVKMMVDSDLGATQTTMFMVQYGPEGVAGPHDHPFEESYLFLEGEAEATFDGQAYRLAPGDVAFAGVGCVHAFRNVGDGPLRWLETQAPQPPARHSYRFVRDWDYLQDVLHGGSERS